ncbi:MAG: DUF6868 family protein [Planctomycetota bacterium]
MTRQSANQLATVLGTAFLVCVGFQLIALAMAVGLHDWAYSMHSKLFALTPEQFDLFCYGFLGVMKTLGLTLFLCPWIALKLTASRFAD